jgi:outer membrane protein assembly factor BamD
MCLYQTGDYILAGYHFKNMYQSFPGHQEAENAAFMVAFCYYLESPKPSLDQAFTYKAMNELQLFINTHPTSQRIEECNMLFDELRAKLEKKSFEIAKVYHRTENYQAAVLAFNHTLNDYPGTVFREQAMFYKLEAAYELAKNSIDSKQIQRYKEARTAFYELMDSYPETEFKRSAERLYEKIEIEINNFNQNA